MDTRAKDTFSLSDRLAASSSSSRFPHPNHLEPVGDYFSRYKDFYAYWMTVRRILLKNVGDSPLASMIALPSFSPEYAVAIEKRGGNYYAVTCVAKSSMSSSRSRREIEKIKVKKSSAPIDSALANRIQDIWMWALSEVKHPKEKILGLDGTTYYFASSKDVVGLKEGRTWSPCEDSVPGALVNVAKVIGKYAKAKEEEREKIRLTLLELLSELEKRLKKASQSDTIATVVELGTVEITAAASAAVAAAGTDPSVYLARHHSGDWGDIDEGRRWGNDLAVQREEQIDSKYKLDDEVELWVSTSADRSLTRVFLETEYERREVSTREGYAMWAESYDKERNPLIAIEEPYVETLVAPLPISSALDVGTGTGRYALKLARRGAAVTAIDQSPEMLAVAQQAARTEGLTIDFQLASLDGGLPFASCQFDFVVCALTLCHVPNLVQVTQEFHRVLQHGGHLLVTDFHPASVAEGWRTVVSRPRTSYRLPNMPHTRSDYLEALATTGFTILNVVDVPVREVPRGYLSDTLIRDYGDKSLCLIVLAQR